MIHSLPNSCLRSLGGLGVIGGLREQISRPTPTTSPVPSVPAGQVGQSMQAAKEAAPHSINATTVRIRHRFVMFRYDYHVWFLVYSLEMVGENPA